MMAAVSLFQSPWAAHVKRGRSFMDVILHIGAHRTGTTSFQHYMRKASYALSEDRVAFWGPKRTRTGLFRGILPDPTLSVRSQPVRRAFGRVRLNLERLERRQRDLLIVSDENMAGSVRENLRSDTLYSGVGRRVSQYCAAFDGAVRQVFLTIRGLEEYHRSSLCYGLARGRRMPDMAALDRLAYADRSWRDVIVDVARSVPGAKVSVLPFEIGNGRADSLYGAMTNRAAPVLDQAIHLNASPNLPELRDISGQPLPDGDGPWRPFNQDQRATMRARYQDDLEWLADGADGLADVIALPKDIRAGPTLLFETMRRGCSNDCQQGRMA